MKTDTKKLVSLSMLAAIAFVAVALIRIPLLAFLSYEPKDVVIVIAGFIYGPLSAALISVVVSLVEMVTISSTGWIGMIMNILSTCAFACLASYLYGRKRTLGNAVAGLAAGTVLMVIVMLLWNYLITPLYMGVPREQVQGMLVPVFLPFNLIKGGLNSAITMLLYKPIVTTLRKAHMLPESKAGVKSGKVSLGVLLVSFGVIATCVLVILALQGVL